MKRRKTLGVVFAYEGLQPTSEASDKKLTSWTGEEKGTLSRSWATQSIEKKTLDRGGNQETLQVVQEIPLILEVRLE